MLQIIAVVLGLAMLWGYVAAAVWLTKQTWALFSKKPEWMRLLLCTLVLAVLFAPAFVGVGHGVGLEFAWMALLDPSSNRFAVRGALISLPITWAILFVVGVIVRSFR